MTGGLARAVRARFSGRVIACPSRLHHHSLEWREQTLAMHHGWVEKGEKPASRPEKRGDWQGRDE